MTGLRKRWPGIASLQGLGIVTLVLFIGSLLIGPDGFGLPPREVQLILLEIRLPRTLLAVLVGGALGLSGAALQGFLRNPLAEPGVIGVSSGAGLGSVLAIHTGASAVFAPALPLAGLAGAAIAVALVLAIAGPTGGTLVVILAGVAVSGLATALISLTLSLAQNPFASVEMVFWLLGSLADRSLIHVWLAAPFIAIGAAILLALGRGLDALTLGEDAAANLGYEPSRLRLYVIAGSALAVGAATAVAGSIGFVGLVVPHLLRRSMGALPSRLLPASGLGGAALVLAADSAVRLLTPGGELRLGVLTALIGTPFFIWLVVDARREALP